MGGYPSDCVSDQQKWETRVYIYIYRLSSGCGRAKELCVSIFQYIPYSMGSQGQPNDRWYSILCIRPNNTENSKDAEMIQPESDGSDGSKLNVLCSLLSGPKSKLPSLIGSADCPMIACVLEFLLTVNLPENRSVHICGRFFEPEKIGRAQFGNA